MVVPSLLRVHQLHMPGLVPVIVTSCCKRCRQLSKVGTAVACLRWRVRCAAKMPQQALLTRQLGARWCLRVSRAMAGSWCKVTWTHMLCVQLRGQHSEQL